MDYRSEPQRCEAFIQSLRDKFPGSKVYGIQADVSKPGDVMRIFDFAEEKFGRLDILINNAGSGPSRMIWDITLEEWNDMLNNNLTGMFMMSKEFAIRLMAGW